MTKHLSAAGRAFLDLPVQHHDLGHTELAYRVTGEGPPLLLIHGWPLWSFTWRKLLPVLARHHRCYLVDLLGSGETRVPLGQPITFRGQVDALKSLTAALDLRDYAVAAFDSGATIARHLVLEDSHRVSALAMMNTEIPHHRPMAIEASQRLLGLPGARSLFRAAIGSRRFVRSRYLFGTCFLDRSHIDEEFLEQFVDVLREDPVRLHGQLEYVLGIDWDMLDALAEGHTRIKQPVLCLWGDRDPWFPLAEARVMQKQLPDCRFETFPAKLFVHEELPEEIATRIVTFLAEVSTAERPRERERELS